MDPADLRPTVTFETALQDGRLTFQRCQDCGNALFYPRVVCPNCGSTELQWSDSNGLGTIYSLSQLQTRQGPGATICLVDLDESFRVMATLTDDRSPAAIGSRVRAGVNTKADPAALQFSLIEGADR